MIRYAITDGVRFGSDAAARQEGLLADVRRWAAVGVDFVQLREKDLPSGELVRLAKAFMAVLREEGSTTKLLVNGRPDVALAAGADGVHLRSGKDELKPVQVRRLWELAGKGRALVSVSCHNGSEVQQACSTGADFVLFAPVFEKRVGGSVAVEGVGLETLRSVCAMVPGMPVLALGGVDEENAAGCVEAGAAGVAGIRLFG